MPSTQEFRRRIKSVQNTRQITKAMEMVASVKMQKAVKTIESARSYIQNSWNMLETLARVTSPENHPLLQKRKIKKVGLLVVTSDRGLCGSYNSSIIQKAISFAKGEQKIGVRADVVADIDLVSVGKKASSPIKSMPNSKLVAEFSGFGKEIEFEEVKPITKLLIDDYISKKYDQIVMIYSHFESSLQQTPVIKQILPITSEHIDIKELWQPAENDENVEYLFEPSPDKVLEGILDQFIRMQIFGAILESNASEHSARMVAMKNANDNAKELIDDLQLTYNTIRQNSITGEISEISAAAEAMS